MKTRTNQFLRIIAEIFRPLFSFLARHYPESFARLRQTFAKDLYFSGMIARFNVWHEYIFKPGFERVRIDSVELTQLKELSQKATLVYVMKNRGQLEYSFFNHLFLKEGIPLARFANGARTIFWRPLSDFIRALGARLDYYYRKGLLEDPLDSGYIEELLGRGESILINLKIYHEFLFGASEDEVKFITPLLKAVAKQNKPVLLVPLQFLYDRHPEKAHKTLIDLFFGEKSNPGMFRKLALFFKTYRRQATVKLGEAMDLKKFVSDNPQDDLDLLSHKLQTILLNQLRIERKSITGPVLKPRHEVLDKILRDSKFKEDLNAFCQESGVSAKKALEDAKHYFHEIAADVNYNYVDVYVWLIRWLTQNIYEGIDLDVEGLAKVKAVAGKNPIVLVPSHKSHIDGLLLSYIFYNYDLTMPHVCGGINMRFWPVGRLIRKAGGFFIRREFGGNKLYKLVLNYYLRYLVKAGHSIEFFIEGTRSRSGKLLKPRMGILSMLMDAYLAGTTKDIYFVPIAINYERIMEAKSYLTEMKGTKKEKEDARGLIKAGKFFNKKYGKVFLRFSEPLSLKEFFDQKNIKPHEKSVSELRKEVRDFAYQITYHINRVAVVTSSALAATALLSYSKKGIPEDQILKRVEILHHYLAHKGVDLSALVRQKQEWATRQALSRFAREGIVAVFNDFKEKFYVILDNKRPLLDYHKNNSVHFFVSLSCFCKVLLMHKGDAIALNLIKNFFETLRVLLSHDFTFSQRTSLDEHLQRIVDFFGSENLMSVEGDLLKINHQAYTSGILDFFGSLLDNFFETTWLVLLYCKHISFTAIPRATLEAAIREKGEVIFMKGDLKHEEALTAWNIRNAVDVMIDLGLIRKLENNLVSRHYDEEVMHRWEETLQSVLGWNVLKSVPESIVKSDLPIELNKIT
ncbi:MAG: hypothetical protein A3G32_09750 [Deltaproteobacteria bacterium RIFCSPLOWO2_12_FULL_40_28]|nr:MAG: hypothetical protein A3C45_04185 [Deltaproteobacteria bacterium RIFCSPHIGHO2_02_FULL_40_28]OGQ21070.1 MAG: hypothetical protein A3E27_00090 [Deltaproteobacteria bacterium RIFCSPHIGHO2_12_FULL_40_32]OGQ38982.1 MAG: hypothetical protein A3I69_07620 [Deltaproteobacteria bacterium RIFCSPLOWO2_02_FULL_40_36]OGQ53036.1 MAG: hypothetical protein A3G32_09750 [Deltaproteobacteria bacterium RIFCSPLOWO2_12_FULL_40_28]